MGVDSIMVTGEHISQLYIDYTKSLLSVNRTYQRKLVWTLEEKQSLIDTIIKGYPVPLFLFVSRRELQADGKYITKREIIDGLQRLEAIISFINNKFPVIIDGEERYYDLSGFSGPDRLVREGKLKQKTPVLDWDICNNFSQYYLAVTTIEADDVSVEDVFKRINATGRQLSPQELRQAGVVSKFSHTVQRIASRLRGDYTKYDIVPLEDMEKYSLSNGKLHYGVDIRNVFWTKQGIINSDGLRRSKDEEIIANLCSCILNEYHTGITKRMLDKAYDDTDVIYMQNEEALTEARQEWLIAAVLAVFEDFDEAFGISGRTFEKLVTSKEKCFNKDLVFIILFLAVFQLRQSGYTFDDYSEFAKLLHNIADTELSELVAKASVSWSVEHRNHLIDRVSNCFKKVMNFGSYKLEWNEELFTLLGKAAVEEQMYDFKIGITDLRSGQYNAKVIEKCVKTLIAMANTKPNEVGYVILGIANDQTASNDFEQHYGKTAIKCNDLFITGVEAEAVKYHNSLDHYLRKIGSGVSSVSNKVLPEAVHYILTHMQVLRYSERSLVVLSLSTDKPLFFDKQLFVRYQSNNKLIDAGSNEFYAVLKSFPSLPGDNGNLDKDSSQTFTDEAAQTSIF